MNTWCKHTLAASWVVVGSSLVACGSVPSGDPSSSSSPTVAAEATAPIARAAGIPPTSGRDHLKDYGDTVATFEKNSAGEIQATLRAKQGGADLAKLSWAVGAAAPAVVIRLDSGAVLRPTVTARGVDTEASSPEHASDVAYAVYRAAHTLTDLPDESASSGDEHVADITCTPSSTSSTSSVTNTRSWQSCDGECTASVCQQSSTNYFTTTATVAADCSVTLSYSNTGSSSPASCSDQWVASCCSVAGGGGGGSGDDDDDDDEDLEEAHPVHTGTAQRGGAFGLSTVVTTK